MLLASRVLRKRWFPGLPQGILLALVVVALSLALSSPRHSEMNLGAALIWQIWWALLPFAVILTARGWCAVCPFPLLGDIAQRLPFVSPSMPSPRVRRIAPWLATTALAALGFLFLLSALESNGPMTAALLLVFTLGVIGSSLVWRRRVWCRYLCPVGMMVGLYSRLSRLRLEVTGDRRAAAALGSRVCPLFTSPVSARRSQDCVLCGACAKGSGGEGTAIQLRPHRDAPRLMPAEAVAVTLLLALMLTDALRMTPLYLRYMRWSVTQIGTSYETSMALGMALVVALLVSIETLSASWHRPGEGFWAAWSRHSVALLPLVLATQTALSAQHLLAAGEVLRNLAAEFQLLAPGHMPPADGYVVIWPMKLFQLALLSLALTMSVRPWRGQKGRRALPGAGFAVSAPVLLFTFVQPMSITC